MLPSPGQTIAGKYRLEHVLGQGGMGAVFKARNLSTGRRVAVKWMLPSAVAEEEIRARIFREARAMGRIEHPNVCQVFDVGEDAGGIFLVMELLEGRSLRAMIAEGPLPVREACQILITAMQGVAAAHAAGVVHRDLKPDNLFVCTAPGGKRGATKVLDFGVSKIVEPGDVDSGPLTRTGVVLGTPVYMSPEQVMGARDLDVRTDIYALGAILYEAITKRMPHEAEGFPALMVHIATCDAHPFEEVAPAEAHPLAPIVHRALMREREGRYADVAELAAALEPFADGVRFEAPVARPLSERPPPMEGPAEPDPAATPPATTPPAPRTAPATADVPVSRPGTAATLRAVPSKPEPAKSIPISIEVTPPEAPHTTQQVPMTRARGPWIAVAIVALLLVGYFVATGAAPAPSEATRPAAIATTPPPRPPAPSPAPTSLPVPATTAAEPPEAPPIAPPEEVGRPAARPRVGSRTTTEPAPPSPTEAEPVRSGTGRSGTLSTDDF